MILVTGAGGKTGQAAVRALSVRGVAVRAAVRHREDSVLLQESGAADVVVGDLRSREHLQLAVDGVAAIHHICPNMRADEVSIAQLVVRSAQIAGCRRFVYHSVLHPQSEEMPHHWQKLRVEELLLRSGLDVTILQPAAYMQNLLAYWPALRAQGVLRIPYAPATRLSLVDLEDVATVAADVLTDDRHSGAIYELVGTPPLDQHAVAALCAEVLGRPVHAEEQPRGVWEEGARAAGMDEYAIDSLLRMFRYYADYGFGGNSFVLAALLRRAPTSLRDFLQRQLT